MKRIHKNIFITSTALALITGVIYLSIGAKTIPSKSNAIKVNKSVYETKIKSPKLLSNTSSNIVIYNSEPYEDYKNGKKVTDIGRLLNDKLKAKGMNSNFIYNNSPNKEIKSYADYSNTYDVSRNLIKQNVKNYNNKILLDICREISSTPKNNIEIALSTENPHYAENKKFANSLIKQFNKLKQNVSVCYWGAPKNFFNQDLSNKGIILTIGNVDSNNKKLNQLMDTTAKALQNVKWKYYTY